MRDCVELQKLVEVKELSLSELLLYTNAHRHTPVLQLVYWLLGRKNMFF